MSNQSSPRPYSSGGDQQGRHYVSSDRTATVVVDGAMMMSKNVKHEKLVSAHVNWCISNKIQKIDWDIKISLKY